LSTGSKAIDRSPSRTDSSEQHVCFIAHLDQAPDHPAAADEPSTAQRHLGDGEGDRSAPDGRGEGGGIGRDRPRDLPGIEPEHDQPATGPVGHQGAVGPGGPAPGR
jgi:hypothetical protein